MASPKNNLLDKKMVLKSIKDMPDEFALDDAIDRLILLNKVQKAEKEIEGGTFHTTEQARKKLKKWLK
jgi:hypothetical protein